MVVGDSGGGLSLIWNVFTDITFLFMIICGHWLLGPMSQIGIKAGTKAGCTNSTDDIERWENEDFIFKSSK